MNTRFNESKDEKPMLKAMTYIYDDLSQDIQGEERNSTDWESKTSSAGDVKGTPLNGFLDTLAQNGVAIVEDYLVGLRLELARSEFLQLIDDQANAPEFLSKGASRIARLTRSELRSERYPTLAAIFAEPFQKAVARRYFSPFTSQLNEMIYAQHDRDELEFNQMWHIDDSRTLKFALHLNDVTTQNGAMWYALGSQREGLFRLAYYHQRGHRVPQQIPDHEVPSSAVPLTAKAGSLVIFDAAGIHRGGPVAMGAERLVIRGFCFSRPTYVARLLRRFILASPLNITRWTLCDEMRANPRFTTRAQTFSDY
jgi:hypothetical protein